MSETWIIASRADLDKYVRAEVPTAHNYELEDALVDALVLQCPIDYGQDWTEWLDDNASGYLGELERAARPDLDADSEETRRGDFLCDQQKDDALRGDS